MKENGSADENELIIKSQTQEQHSFQRITVRTDFKNETSISDLGMRDLILTLKKCSMTHASLIFLQNVEKNLSLLLKPNSHHHRRGRVGCGISNEGTWNPLGVLLTNPTMTPAAYLFRTSAN